MRTCAKTGPTPDASCCSSTLWDSSGDRTINRDIQTNSLRLTLLPSRAAMCWFNGPLSQVLLLAADSHGKRSVTWSYFCHDRTQALCLMQQYAICFCHTRKLSQFNPCFSSVHIARLYVIFVLRASSDIHTHVKTDFSATKHQIKKCRYINWSVVIKMFYGQHVRN